MTRRLEVSDAISVALVETAKAVGETPADGIAAHLPSVRRSER
jgi:hypothetical protein